MHEAGGSGRTSVEDSDHAAVVALGPVLGVGTNGPKPPMEVATELEVEANRMERYENGPGGQSYGVKTFYRDGPRCKRGEDDHSRTASPDDGRYVWWTTYGAGPRSGQICRPVSEQFGLLS